MRSLLSLLKLVTVLISLYFNSCNSFSAISNPSSIKQQKVIVTGAGSSVGLLLFKVSNILYIIVIKLIINNILMIEITKEKTILPSRTCSR